MAAVRVLIRDSDSGSGLRGLGSEFQGFEQFLWVSARVAMRIYRSLVFSVAGLRDQGQMQEFIRRMWGITVYLLMNILKALDKTTISSSSVVS